MFELKKMFEKLLKMVCEKPVKIVGEICDKI
jgi:hypothetical protein